VKPILPPGVFRRIALVLMLTGAFGSLYFVLRTGYRNHSVLLVLLFVFWVLSPFMALMVASVISNRWSAISRSALYILIFVLPVCSLFFYSGTWMVQGTRPAFIFLMVPLASWILIAIVLLLASQVGKKIKNGKETT
jgi:uncharacterized membrane protein YhaH (DUF805 family)